LRQVLRHRHRYWGVIIAIALGTAGLVTVITMGQDLRENFGQDLNLIGGVTVIRVRFDNQQASRPQWFQPTTIEALRRLPGVAYASMVAGTHSAAIWRGRQERIKVIAVDGYFWQVRSFEAQTGALFGHNAVLERKRQCVLGAELAKRLYGRTDVAGELFELSQNFFEVTGVLEDMTDTVLANAAYLPLTTAQDRLTGDILADHLYVRCYTPEDVAGVAASIRDIIQSHQSAEQLYIDVAWDKLNRVLRVTWWVEFFVHVAIATTLLLGGVGIFNVMMAAVRSRTREIGLKKAMGAEDLNILMQFLTEALTLSLAATLAGVGLSRLAMEFMVWSIGTRPSENLFLVAVALSLLFAVILGAAAGLYPSVKASRMEVISATRYE
jgi:putative ABC transport system permease protein